MGITFNNACLMAKAKNNGACFDKVLTIGHQSMYISAKDLKKLSQAYGCADDVRGIAGEKYADNLFRKFFGVKELHTLDYSRYQGSDIIHDMNLPVPEKYHNAFDVVIDSGSLEHICNFPVAISNCMKMLKPGGSIFIFNMANNHMGHGFYQFSPELFFRVFQPENGFKASDIVLERHPFPGSELSANTRCYSVVDPAVLKERVGLVCSSPITVMVHAEKTETKPVFETYPIQSDYLLSYSSENEDSSCAKGQGLKGCLKALFRCMPCAIKNYIIGKLQLYRYSFCNKRFYRRWNPLS